MYCCWEVKPLAYTRLVQLNNFATPYLTKMSKSFLILESLFSRNCWVRCFRWYQTGLGVNLNLPTSFFRWSVPVCPSLHLVSWKVVPYFRKSSLIFILYPRLHCLQTIPFTAVYLPPPPRPGLLIGTLRCHDGDVNGNRLNRQNNNFARASSFLVHFFTVTARLRRENA